MLVQDFISLLPNPKKQEINTSVIRKAAKSLGKTVHEATDSYYQLSGVSALPTSVRKAFANVFQLIDLPTNGAPTMGNEHINLIIEECNSGKNGKDGSELEDLGERSLQEWLNAMGHILPADNEGNHSVSRITLSLYKNLPEEGL